MKKRFVRLFLLACAAMGGTVLIAQPWMDAFNQSTGKKQPPLHEIERAFNTYWSTRDTTVKGKGYKPFKRWLWFMESRVDNNGHLDPSARWQAWREAQKNFKGRTGKNLGADWQVLGPEAMIPRRGGGAGRVGNVAFHPTNPAIMWAGTPAGGLWKTTDRGQTWSTLTDNLPVLGVSSILVDPVNPDILYIATGDGDARDTYSVGVLKSVDGGGTWEVTGLQTSVSNSMLIYKLAMHPTDRNTILAVGNEGIFRSSNGGENWDNIMGGWFTDIEVHPTNPDRWYAAAPGWRTSGGIWVSDNAGAGWSRVSNGLPGENFRRIELAVTPAAPNTVYAVIAEGAEENEDDEDGFLGFYRSTNSGQSWVLEANRPNLLGWETTGTDQGGQSWYDLTIAASPVDANTVFVGGVNLWRSTDGGRIWTAISNWYPVARYPYVHADQHFLGFSPHDDTTLYSGNDGGLFVSGNNGTAWEDLSDGLGIHQFYRVAISEQEPNLFIGGSQDNGSSVLQNGEWEFVFGGDGMNCEIDYTRPNVIYASSQYGLLGRSSNYGQSFVGITNGIGEEGAWVTPYLLHPTDPNTLFYATDKVYKSTNQGASWTAISPVLVAPEAVILHLDVAPSNPDVIYASLQELQPDGSRQPYFFRTLDGGRSWQKMENLPFPRVSYFDIHPYKPLTVYLTASAYFDDEKVYRSDDGGVTWRNISGSLPNIPVNCVRIDPTRPENVYVGTDVGIYLSVGGDDWEPYNTGLPNVMVYDIEINSVTRKLYAGTHGRGLWVSPLSSAEKALPGLRKVVPWVVNNDQWLSRIAIYNRGESQATVSMKAVNQQGLSLTEIVTIPPRGVFAKDSDALFGDFSGYSLQLHSDSNQLFPSFLTYNKAAASGRSPAQTTGADLPALTPNLLFGYVPGSELPALVLLAPNAATGTGVKLTLYGESGEIANTTVSLSANRPLASLLTNLFPNVSIPNDAAVLASSLDGVTNLAGTTFVFNADFREPSMAGAFILSPGIGHGDSVVPWVVNNDQWLSRVAAFNNSENDAMVTFKATSTEGVAESMNVTIPAHGVFASDSDGLFSDLSGYSLTLESESDQIFASFLTFNKLAASGRSPAQTTGTPLNTAGNKLLFGYLPMTELPAIVLVAPEAEEETPVTLRLYGPEGAVGEQTVTLQAGRPLAGLIRDLFAEGELPPDVAVEAEAPAGTKLVGTTFVFNENFREPSMAEPFKLPSDEKKP